MASTPSFIDFGNTARIEGGADVDLDGIIENTIDSTTRNAGMGVFAFAGLQNYSGVIRGNLFDRQQVETMVQKSSSPTQQPISTSSRIHSLRMKPTTPLREPVSTPASLRERLQTCIRNSQLVMSVGGTVPGQGNVFTNNGDAGVIFSTEGFVGSPTRQRDRSFLSVQGNLFEGTFNNTSPNTNVSPDGAGVFVRRSGASLLTALIGDGIANNGLNGNMFTGNDVGVQVVGAGSEQSALNGFSASMVYIDDNAFDANGNGIQYDLTADAVLQSFVVTNSITNSRDAIQVNSSNNSSFGMPVQATNGEDLNFDGVLQQWEDTDFDGILQAAGPTVLSSVFDSNFIQGFEDDGIDINHTFEAFQNLRISGRQLDQFGNQIRTIIDGQGAGNNGIEILSSGSHVVQNNPGTNLWTIQGVDIFDVGADGININTISGENTFIIGSPEVTGNPFGGQYVRVWNSGDDGLDVLSNGVARDNFFINNFMTTMNGDDGAVFFQDSLADVAVNITSSVFNQNEGNGLQADIRSTSTSVDGTFTAVYNIGTEDTAHNSTFTLNNDGAKLGYSIGSFVFVDEDVDNTGNLATNTDLNGNGILDFGEDVTQTGGMIPGVAGNTFSNNNEQGFFFQTLAEGIGGALAGEITLVDALAPTNPRNTQGGNENGGDTFPNVIFDGENEAFLFADADSTSVRTATVLNFVNNQVTDNGSRAGNAVDGMVLQIGTNTQQIAWLDGNLFGGNELDDLRTQVVVSANPQNSATLGNPNRTSDLNLIRSPSSISPWAKTTPPPLASRHSSYLTGI